MSPLMPPTESRDAAIHRLAETARDHGVKVYTYPRTGEWYATSVTRADRLFRVTLATCDCPGFVRKGVCVHHAALLDHLGQLPAEVSGVIVGGPDRPIVRFGSMQMRRYAS